MNKLLGRGVTLSIFPSSSAPRSAATEIDPDAWRRTHRGVAALSAAATAKGLKPTFGPADRPWGGA